MRENNRIKYIAGILLILYVGYYSCVSLFIHTHIYNGVVYVHSHPFADGTGNDDYGKQNHQHSTAVFYSLNQLSSLLSHQADYTATPDIARTAYTIPYNTYIEGYTKPFDQPQHPLRAPPFYL